MDTDLDDFERFMKRREEAARAYVRGDATALSHITARSLPATFFGPMGGYLQGSSKVSSKYEQDARLFGPGGETSFEILHSAAGGDVAYWTGIQHATVRIGGSGAATAMKLRVTEVFRREGDAWKLVHRHADALDTVANDK